MLQKNCNEYIFVFFNFKYFFRNCFITITIGGEGLAENHGLFFHSKEWGKNLVKFLLRNLCYVQPLNECLISIYYFSPCDEIILNLNPFLKAS